MPRQLTLGFGNIRETDEPVAPRDNTSSPHPARDQDVEEIAQSLRPRVLDCLRAASGDVGIVELRSALGIPGECPDGDPQTNPVNRILKQMRDAGEVVCREFDRGEPLFSLAQQEDSDAADILGTESIPPFELNPLAAAPPLVRPDRQFTFDGVPHYEWPEPEEDRDTLTVDRMSTDIDGPAHRFVIRRGDTVEVFFRRDKLEIGEVVGISLANREVRVSFREGTDGIWFAVGQIYPAVEATEADRDTAPLSQLAEQASSAPTVGFSEQDRVPDSRDSQSEDVMESRKPQHRPFTLADYRTFLEQLNAGDLDIARLQAEFRRLVATHEDCVTTLQKEKDATQLKALASRLGCFDAKRNTKKQNAEYVYRTMLQGFTLSASVTYQPLRETYEEAAGRIVEALTDENLVDYVQQRRQEQRDREQALADPQTIEQFRLCLRDRDYRELTPEQQERFDRLLADQSRAVRRERRQSATVTEIQSDGREGLDITIVEGRHTKHDIPLWICQLSTRVDAATFRELKIKASQLGGWWSSFVKHQVGFQFKTPEAAERFAALLAGNVDRSDILADRKARKMESAGERLLGVSETLEREAREILDADEGKLKNTVRRSEMAAGMRGRAYANQAMVGTLRSIATALDAGGAQYLDGVRAATHLETLLTILRRAKTKRNELLLKERGELGVWERHAKSEELGNRPLEVADAGFAQYPYPAIYRRHLEELVAAARGKSGLKQLSRRLDSFLATDREKHVVEFVDDADSAFLQDYLIRCRAVRIETRFVEQGMEDCERLRAADIFTPQELRCSLRELIPHLGIRNADDPVQVAEAKLIGLKQPGFLPTPRPVISRMLELAEIKDGDHVLEPSAGMGDILDVIREQHPDAPVTAIEQNQTLFDVLEAKGHDVSWSDFLEYSGEHDVVVMNPPFENLADIDHVQHAFKQLAPGGRLVSVMGAGAFFRSDKKAEQFRAWLKDLDAEIEDLPDDAFKGTEAFRQTGVRTRLVVLSRPLQTPADH